MAHRAALFHFGRFFDELGATEMTAIGQSVWKADGLHVAESRSLAQFSLKFDALGLPRRPL